jgi:hypothetical protein
MLRKIYLLRNFMKPFQGLMLQGESHYQGPSPFAILFVPFGDELKLF